MAPPASSRRTCPRPRTRSTVVTSTSIGWTDTNHDFLPQCNLLNPNANGECMPWQNPNFGSLEPSTTYDPNLLTGTTTGSSRSAPAGNPAAGPARRELLRRIYGNFQMRQWRRSGFELEVCTPAYPVDLLISDHSWSTSSPDRSAVSAPSKTCGTPRGTLGGAQRWSGAIRGAPVRSVSIL
jgi:hypothetical protein